jgi:hypothetical protein
MTPELARRQQSILYLHRTLLRAGLSLVATFAWIFIFEFTLDLSQSLVSAFLVAILAYAVSQVVCMLATPLSAAHLRHGMKRAMLFGACFAALSFAVLGATLAGYFSSPISWGPILFGMLLGAYRALYWIPYRLQAANFARQPNMFFELLLALLPAFAGVTLVSVYFSSLRLLFGASALMLVSIIPIFFLRDSGESFRWGYFESFAKLFDRRYQTLALRSTLSGIEAATLFLIWPIAVFLIVGRSYLIFGLVMSASLMILLAARSLYRDLMRSGFARGSISLDVAFAVSGWVLRLVSGTPLMIVVADSYSYVSAPAGSPEYVAREHAADGGSYLDEYTALQEIGVSFGGIIMCAFVGILLFTIPLPIVLALSLILAGVAAGSAAFLSHKIRAHAY